jgi:hypothetical protein
MALLTVTVAQDNTIDRGVSAGTISLTHTWNMIRGVLIAAVATVSRSDGINRLCAGITGSASNCSGEHRPPRSSGARSMSTTGPQLLRQCRPAGAMQQAARK